MAPLDYLDLERLRSEIRAEMLTREEKLQSSIQRLIEQLHVYCVTQEKIVLKLDTYLDLHSLKISALENSVEILERRNVEVAAKNQLLSTLKPVWIFFGKLIILSLSLSVTFSGVVEILKTLKM